MNQILGTDNGYEYTSATPGGVERGNVPNWAEMDTDLPAECPTFAIDLSDLFPFLKTHQLPLYMISEPINIELTFYPTTGKRLQVGDGDALLSPALINRNDLKFCADYIFYGSGDEMEQFANKNKNMSFSFVDYRLVESTISEASVRSGLIRNLVSSRRKVI